MKHRIVSLIIMNCIFMVNATAQDTGTCTDSRDGKTYTTVKVDTFTIMAQNLAFKPEKGNYWAYDNDTTNVAKYGYLYDWETAKVIAPPGWHLPTKDEWLALSNYLESKNENIFIASIESGCGFDEAIGGWRNDAGEFVNMGTFTLYWSSTPSDSSAAWGFITIKGKIGSTFFAKAGPSSGNGCRSCGFGVRLIQD